MRVNAVVTDLDGTIIRPDFSVSRLTLGALDAVRAAGIALVFATGRTPQGVRQARALADRADIAVCCSGAIGCSQRSPVQLWHERLAPEAVASVVELAADVGAGVASFDGEMWRTTVDYDRLGLVQLDGEQCVTVEPAALAEFPSSAMALRSAGDGLAAVPPMLVGVAQAALSQVGDSTVLDIAPDGVDKGTGARRALGMLGVAPEAAISFGDMPNDLPLFAATGHSCAVGGHPIVVSAADEALMPVQRDGFGHRIAALARMGWVIR